MKKCKKVVDKQSPTGVPCEHRQGKQPGRKKFKKIKKGVDKQSAIWYNGNSQKDSTKIIRNKKKEIEKNDKRKNRPHV